MREGIQDILLMGVGFRVLPPVILSHADRSAEFLVEDTTLAAQLPMWGATVLLNTSNTTDNPGACYLGTKTPTLKLQTLTLDPRPLITKSTPLNRDYSRDPNIKALIRRGFTNHGSTLDTTSLKIKYFGPLGLDGLA